MQPSEHSSSSKTVMLASGSERYVASSQGKAGGVNISNCPPEFSVSDGPSMSLGVKLLQRALRNGGSSQESTI